MLHKKKKSLIYFGLTGSGAGGPSVATWQLKNTRLLLSLCSNEGFSILQLGWTPEMKWLWDQDQHFVLLHVFKKKKILFTVMCWIH